MRPGRFVAHYVPVEKILFFQDIYQTLKLAAILLSYDLVQQTENYRIVLDAEFGFGLWFNCNTSIKMLARLAGEFHLIAADTQAVLLAQVVFRQCKRYC